MFAARGAGTKMAADDTRQNNNVAEVKVPGAGALGEMSRLTTQRGFTLILSYATGSGSRRC